MSRSNVIATAFCVSLLVFGMTACKQKGPVERAGEKVDKVIDTAKNGGKETTADKVDDAADHVTDGVKDAAHDLKK
jgi:predicted small lipoprotein YifL